MVRWGLGVRILHWMTVLILIAQLVVVFGLQGPGMAMMIWMPWHLSLGVALLGVVLLRLALRTFPRPKTASIGWIVGAMQTALYLTLIAVTLTGWFAYRPSGLAPTPLLFGLLPMRPVHLSLSVPWASWHRALVWALLALVAAHVAIALYHFAILKDRVLHLMLFGRVDKS